MRRVRTADLVDTLPVDDELFVLLDQKLVRLAPLAATIVELSAEAIDTSQLAVELEAVFGAPTDIGLLQATEAAVDELVAQGVLVELEATADPVP